MKTLLLGDVSPTVHNAHLFAEQNVSALFGDATSVFEHRDFVFVNLECALTEAEKEIPKFGPPLKAPKETANVLKTLGVDCCGLSNNHVFDYGIDGMLDTLRALQGAGLGYTGFGKDYEDSRKNYTVEKNGERIAIVAVCEHEYSYALENRMGSRPYDEYDTMEDIRNAKKDHDRVIVIYHGGKEYSPYPSPRLHKLCHAMARNGADVVLCQHSHCIGCYEQYENCHILYGQGNFHFVRPDRKRASWHTSLAVEYDTAEHKISFVPLRAGNAGIGLAVGEDAEQIMKEFCERSQKLQNGEWKDGWHAFCHGEAKDLYLTAIGRACLEDSTSMEHDRFGHFLDCEAHTDVWRELFPSYNLTNETDEREIEWNF